MSNIPTLILGRTGPPVSRLGLGTMSLLTSLERREAIALVHEAIDAGLSLIDTADVYADGAVEELLGAALRDRRDEVVLATKVGLAMGGDSQCSGGSRRWVHTAVRDSLRRLRTDRIDLYQLHRPDPATPVEETVDAFGELIDQGLVRYAGSSVFPAELVVETRWAAERSGRPAWVSEQLPYSMLVRGVERAVLPTCRRHGIGVLVWGPLNGGWLTGKYRRGEAPPAGSRAAAGNPFVRVDDERKLDVVEQLSAVADQAGLDLTTLALAWPLQHPAVSSVLIGPRTPEQLRALLRAAQVRLSADVLDAVDAVVAPGTDVDPRNAGWVSPGLAPQARRFPDVLDPTPHS